MEEALPGSLPRHAGLDSLDSLDSLASLASLASLDTFTSFTDQRIRSKVTIDSSVSSELLVLGNAKLAASVHLQVALISFARDVLGIADATSEEFDPLKTSASYTALP